MCLLQQKLTLHCKATIPQFKKKSPSEVKINSFMDEQGKVDK